MAAVHTKEELNDAMKRGDNTIEIEGDLANRVVRIKATGAVAWAIAAGAIGIAVYAAIALIPSGGTTAPVSGVAAATGAAFLGVETVTAAIGLAVAAGGIGILTRLRSDYRITSTADNRVVLEKV